MPQEILLLEDDDSLNHAISLKLKKEGYTVHSAFTVKEALPLFQNKNLSLIICDISLPDGNGLDFCSRVRQESDILFLFLTALDREEDIMAGYRQGADDYITKPFSMAALTAKEYSLLSFFMENPMHILSRNQLLEAIWDIDGNFVDENTLSVNIRRLREKIEDDPSAPAVLKNIRGLGYIWERKCEKR